ncbi:MAG: hypothetical protein V3V13_10345 [Paracoccaceae bacterium]
MKYFRNFFSILSLVILVACADDSSDPVEQVIAAKYINPEPASITLMTMVSAGGDFGEHSAILINASQQVLYDPAGSFRDKRLARARDVHYGVTPYMAAYYNSYHARFGYYVKVQKISVTPELAEEIFQRAVAQGTTGQLRCGLSVSSVLNGVPMFSSIRTTYYPGKIMDDFAKIPGVSTTYVRENDIGQNY